MDELAVLSRKLEEFWGRYRAGPDSRWYIPPSQTSNTDGIIGEISRLVGLLKRLKPEEFEALRPTHPEPGCLEEAIPLRRASCVFIGHGRSKLWARLQVYLERELSLQVINYESESRVGESIVPILEQMLQQATFAVLAVTGEDETSQGSVRARQNVIHEAGLFQGQLGFRKVVLLMQEGVEEFTNVAGLQHIPFSGERVEQTFYELGRVLKREGQVA